MRSGWSRWWRWGMVIAGVLGMLALGSATVHELVSTMTERNYPRPGMLVDVGGHRIHLHRQGAGTPAVVIEAGVTGASYDWERVAAGIAKFTQVVTYDRAGYGWSERGPSPRSSQQVVKELRKLVERAEIQTPFILLGHSWGGLNARLYESTYPDDVAALALIEALNTDLASPNAPIGQVSAVDRLANTTAGLGGTRLLLKLVLGEPSGDAEALTMRRSMLSRTATAQTVYEELSGQTNWLEVRSLLRPIGDKPLLVMARRGPDGTNSPDPRVAAEIAWQRQQLALQDLSSRTRWVTASTTAHELQFHDQALLIDEVRRLVDLLRSLKAEKTSAAQ